MRVPTKYAVENCVEATLVIRQFEGGFGRGHERRLGADPEVVLGSADLYRKVEIVHCATSELRLRTTLSGWVWMGITFLPVGFVGVGADPLSVLRIRR